MGILLSMVAGFFKVLVVLNGGTNVEGELGIDNMVNSISKGGEVVKEDNLVMFERGAGVINRDNLQDMIVNGVTFSEGRVHFGVVRINIIIEEGGNDKIAGGQIRNGELIVGSSEWIIQYPPLTWVVSIHPLEGRMLLVFLWRLGCWVPGIIIGFGLLVVVGPGRIVF
jgi:hypothetical protein